MHEFLTCMLIAVCKESLYAVFGTYSLCHFERDRGVYRFHMTLMNDERTGLETEPAKEARIENKFSKI